MLDGWTRIDGHDEYKRILMAAQARVPVLINGYRHIVMEVEFDAAKNRGRYKAVQIEPPLAERD